jgi:cation:H+ antiporter
MGRLRFGRGNLSKAATRPFQPIQLASRQEIRMFMDAVLLLVGLALLLAGGESLVRGAVALSYRFGLPPLLVGLVIVGFGTSMPELLVSVQAALVGSPDIAVGNVVGSNTSNILLILGFAALLAPISAKIPGLKRDVIVMVIVALATLGLGWYGIVSRLLGGAIFAMLLAYLLTIYLLDRNNPSASEATAKAQDPLWRTIAFVVGGLIALFVGADLLVDTASRIAREFGISEAVIGLTVVAIGTSLPELATAVVAAFRRQAEVALGNVVGSNIFNIFGILGVTALITPVPVADQIASFDIPVMVAVSIFLLALIFVRRGIDRLTGSAMLVTYAAYVYWLFQ